MAKTRDNYQITGNSLDEVKNNLNFLLQRFADRMDKIEGIRGTATIESDLDLNNNALVDVGDADTGGVVISEDLTVAGTTTLTGAVTTGSTLTVSTTADANIYTVTDTDSQILHQMGG